MNAFVVPAPFTYNDTIRNEFTTGVAGTRLSDEVIRRFGVSELGALPLQ